MTRFFRKWQHHGGHLEFVPRFSCMFVARHVLLIRWNIWHNMRMLPSILPIPIFIQRRNTNGEQLWLPSLSVISTSKQVKLWGIWKLTIALRNFSKKPSIWLMSQRGETVARYVMIIVWTRLLKRRLSLVLIILVLHWQSVHIRMRKPSMLLELRYRSCTMSSIFRVISRKMVVTSDRFRCVNNMIFIASATVAVFMGHMPKVSILFR